MASSTTLWSSWGPGPWAGALPFELLLLLPRKGAEFGVLCPLCFSVRCLFWGGRRGIPPSSLWLFGVFLCRRDGGGWGPAGKGESGVCRPLGGWGGFANRTMFTVAKIQEFALRQLPPKNPGGSSGVQILHAWESPISLCLTLAG